MFSDMPLDALRQVAQFALQERNVLALARGPSMAGVVGIAAGFFSLFVDLVLYSRGLLSQLHQFVASHGASIA
jgi:hypothetical protein